MLKSFFTKNCFLKLKKVEDVTVNNSGFIPVEGEIYWMCDAYGETHRLMYRNDILMNKLVYNANLFQSKNDAIEASIVSKNARISYLNKK